MEYADLFHHIEGGVLQGWLDRGLKEELDRTTAKPHGDLPRWQQAVARLPSVAPSEIHLDKAAVTIGKSDDCSDELRICMESNLRELHPWRKGPFDLFGVKIDTEWRSDRKWDRLIDHIEPLANRTVLDVGCGNGYHCWRMAGAGAKTVIGIDPTWLYVMQYHAVRRYVNNASVWVLPLGIEALPDDLNAFDTVFSMGVFYHRRSPFDHLRELLGTVRPGGQIVLETLVVEGDENTVLLPPERYASMRNVWFLPSPLALEKWLRRAGFRQINLVDNSITRPTEQRGTDWMRFHSLTDFLDPHNAALTVEGHPAPRRAIFTAMSPY